MDKLIERCKDCGFAFTWTAGEQHFYVTLLSFSSFFWPLRAPAERGVLVWWCVQDQKGFKNEPLRCKPCQKQRRASKGAS